MFKFKDYPQLIDYHKAYVNVGKAATRALINIVDYKIKSAEKKFDNLIKKRIYLKNYTKWKFLNYS